MPSRIVNISSGIVMYTERRRRGSGSDDGEKWAKGIDSSAAGYGVHIIKMFNTRTTVYYYIIRARC